MSINVNLREQLLAKTPKRKFRVQMLNQSQQKLREGIENKLHIKKHCKSIASESKKICPTVKCTRKCTHGFFLGLFPFLRIMRYYSLRKNLLPDVTAGLTVGIMHIPQGMAYGFLAGLPPIYGLYTSFFPVILYFFFGSSKHISVGTFAVVSLMVGQAVNRGYAQHSFNAITIPNTTAAPVNATPIPTTPQSIHGDTGQDHGYADPVKLAFALSVTFVVGVIQLLFGIMRLGYMATFMSDPFISGFTTGAAVHVFSSQIKHIFGITVRYHHGPLALVYFYAEFFLNIKTTNMVTFTASITCVLILVLIKEGINNNNSCRKELFMPIPIDLIVIVVSTIVSYYTKLETKFDVHTVGIIPQGLPVPRVDHLRYIPDVLGDGLIIGFIGYAISYSMAKILADRHGYRVNANQEMVALGVCNFVSSFFSSYSCAASLSRSLVQDSAGGKTQVVGLVSSTVVLVVLLYIGPLFHTLPECILAAIVIVTLKGMFMQARELKRLWRLSKKDFAVWLVTFTAVVILDVALGLLIGIVFSLYFVLRHSQKPQMCQLGNVPGTNAYKDMRTSSKLNEVEGMKVFRFEASIYFANAEHFRDRLYEKTKMMPRRLKKKKRQAMHDTLQRRRQELEVAELQRRREAEKNQKHKLPSVEIVVSPQQIDAYEEHQKTIRENKLILERFAKAWQPPVKLIIIDLSVVNYIDTVAVKTLSNIVNDYKEVGIKVFLAGCKPDVRKMLRQAEFYSVLDYNCMYFTVHEAVVIGRELLEAEAKKDCHSRETINLFRTMSRGDVNEEEEIHEEDEAEDEEEELKELKSDTEDDIWYDTSPHDSDGRPMTPEIAALLREDITRDKQTSDQNTKEKFETISLEDM